MLLGDYGADVLKIEHPRGDPARTHGPSRDGHRLWWKVISRTRWWRTTSVHATVAQSRAARPRTNGGWNAECRAPAGAVVSNGVFNNAGTSDGQAKVQQDHNPLVGGSSPSSGMNRLQITALDCG
jgi:hypothetical protein